MTEHEYRTFGATHPFHPAMPILALLLIVSIWLGGCATTPVTVNDYCAIARPILVSKSDTLTDETARAILTANETGAKLCKWKHK